MSIFCSPSKLMSDLKMENTKRYDKLVVDFSQKRTDENIVIVKNFPGLFAEMNEVELRAIAQELSIAADKLHNLNE